MKLFRNICLTLIPLSIFFSCVESKTNEQGDTKVSEKPPLNYPVNFCWDCETRQDVLAYEDSLESIALEIDMVTYYNYHEQDEDAFLMKYGNNTPENRAEALWDFNRGCENEDIYPYYPMFFLRNPMKSRLIEIAVYEMGCWGYHRGFKEKSHYDDIAYQTLEIMNSTPDWVARAYEDVTIENPLTFEELNSLLDEAYIVAQLRFPHLHYKRARGHWMRAGSRTVVSEYLSTSRQYLEELIDKKFVLGGINNYADTCVAIESRTVNPVRTYNRDTIPENTSGEHFAIEVEDLTVFISWWHK